MEIFEAIKNYVLGIMAINVVEATFWDVLQFMGIILGGAILLAIVCGLVICIVKLVKLSIRCTHRAFANHKKAVDRIICPRCGKPFSACDCADTKDLTAKQKLAAFKKRNKLVKKAKKVSAKSK